VPLEGDDNGWCLGVGTTAMMVSAATVVLAAMAVATWHGKQQNRGWGDSTNRGMGRCRLEGSACAAGR
jgi:hypothetical protein